jgi:hypothetical protein
MQRPGDPEEGILIWETNGPPSPQIVIVSPGVNVSALWTDTFIHFAGSEDGPVALALLGAVPSARM